MLVKLFIKNHQDTESPAVREKYGLLSGVFGIVFNMLLAVLKFFVGTLVNSVSITADAFNNLTDCLTSLLTILGFRWSAKPADREHPFGHSRIEYLISLAVAGIIILTGYEVARSSITMIITPEPMNFYPAAVTVLIFGMVVKLWMSVFNKKLGRAIKSDTLLAVGVDSRNDVLITAATLVSLVFSRFVDFSIDGYVGALIALVFLRSGYKVAKEALGRIIGNPADKSLAANIKEIIKSQDGVLGVHDLVVHSYGPGRDMASVHVEVAADMTLVDSHEITVQIAGKIGEALGVEMVIHMDPIDIANKNLQDIVGQVQEFLCKEYPALHAHEFRIVNTAPKPTLAFDLEIPHDDRDNAIGLRDAIITGIGRFVPGYDFEVNIEYGYID
ncbi:MAG: cation diffusion facilitator family transporter [Defluviitaleaceae bacterium]|nr:cation diffusion facilitator family transporter [Defluviitaleaceae bacterium]